MAISKLRIGKLLVVPLLVAAGSALNSPAIATPSELVPWDQLGQLSLQQLMALDVVVTSVAKKPQQLSDTPAAVFVISQDDIHRSGATSIPELLRMVPGIQVARVEVISWAISARGFNDFFANKLLVLIDGRSVYTPLFAGVYWDVQDTLLEDIERIEVIRGPGGTVWGANAVNGVVNIITKHASETQGRLLAAGGGHPQERGFASLRHGGTLGEDAYYRLFVKGFSRDVFEDSVFDDWRSLRGGFRVDWDPSAIDAVSVQGEAYGARFKELDLPSVSRDPPAVDEAFIADDVSGWHLMGRWQHTLSAHADLLLQIYYDHVERDEVTLRQQHNIFDIDFRHRFRLSEHQELIWGLGFRHTNDKLDESFKVRLGFEFDPGERATRIFSAFLQDELRLTDDLTLTVGSKFEHNSYSGFEVQPSVRLLWMPEPSQRVWAAVSRAVQTPSRLVRDGRQLLYIERPETPDEPLFLSTVADNDSFDSETLVAYELGYRIQPHKRLALDVAAFYNRYDRLKSFEFAGLFEDSLVIEERFVPENKIAAESFGAELALTWQPTEEWILKGVYNYLKIDARTIEDGEDIYFVRFTEEGSPRHQASLRSQWDLRNNLGIDVWLRYVGETADPEYPDRVPSYITADIGLRWKPVKNLELSLVGQNLIESSHRESVLTYGEVQRGFYGRLRWEFAD